MLLIHNPSLNETGTNLYTQMSVRKVEEPFSPLPMDEAIYSGNPRDCDSIYNSLPEDDYQGYRKSD